MNPFSAINELQSDTALGVALTYDQNGNTTRIVGGAGAIVLRYDGANRLRVFADAATQIEYLYDHGGLLIERKSTDVATGKSTTTALRYLLRKPIVLERNGAVDAVLTWGPADRLLRVVRANVAANTPYGQSVFPVHDVGTAIVRFFDEHRNTLLSVTCDAWGTPVVTVGDAGLMPFWTYRGGLFDPGTNFLLFGARWYWPAIGRWMSADPLFWSPPEVGNYLELGNLYTYSANDPVNRSDPAGLSTDPPIPSESQALGRLLQVARDSSVDELTLDHVTEVAGGQKILSFVGTSSERDAGAFLVSVLVRDSQMKEGTVLRLDQATKRAPSGIKYESGRFWLRTLKASTPVLDFLRSILPASLAPREGDPAEWQWEDEQKNIYNSADIRG